MGEFDWRWAFDPDMDGAPFVNERNLELVKDAILDWSDWTVHTDSNGFIIRVEHDNGDGIWDWDYEDSLNVNEFFMSDFIRYMDKKFKLQPFKPKVVVGKSTILPLPGDRPPSSSKGASPSSSF